MDRTRAVILLIGVAAVAGASGLGYWLGGRLEQAGRPEGSPTPTAAGSPEIEPFSTATPTSEGPAATPTPAATPSPTPAPSAPRGGIRLTLGAVPATIPSGSSLRVQWFVSGPADVRGQSTRLIVTLSGEPATASPVAKDFQLPAAFEATVTAARPGTLRVVAEVVVDGRTLRAEHRVTVQP